MNNDRELLEKAAKAAGMNVFPEAGAEPWPKVDGWFFCMQHGDPGMHFCPADNRAHRTGPWKPLHEDGDALRLAVKLNISIQRPVDGDNPAHWGTYACMPNQEHLGKERDGGDPYAATRRAIVRAAASIGEQMP